MKEEVILKRGGWDEAWVKGWLEMKVERQMEIKMQVHGVRKLDPLSWFHDHLLL